MVDTGAITAAAGAGRRGTDRVSCRLRRLQPAGSPTGRPNRRSRSRRPTPTPSCAPRSIPRLQAMAEARLIALLDGPGAAADVSAGRGGGAGCGHRRRARHGRRSRLSRKLVQSRGAGAPAAGLGVQAICLAGGAGKGRPARTTPCWTRRSGSATGARADFERRYLGEITVEEALAQSINTSAVRLLLQAGGPRVVRRRSRRGSGSPTSCRTTPRSRLAPGRSGCWNLTSAYARSSMAERA